MRIYCTVLNFILWHTTLCCNVLCVKHLKRRMKLWWFLNPRHPHCANHVRTWRRTRKDSNLQTHVLTKQKLRKTTPPPLGSWSYTFHCLVMMFSWSHAGMSASPGSAWQWMRCVTNQGHVTFKTRGPSEKTCWHWKVVWHCKSIGFEASLFTNKLESVVLPAKRSSLAFLRNFDGFAPRFVMPRSVAA